MVALRGTTSVEDIITDSVAEPVRLEPDWLPGEIKARDGSGGHLYAHAGIKAAAVAVLKVFLSFLILLSNVFLMHGSCAIPRCTTKSCTHQGGGR